MVASLLLAASAWAGDYVIDDSHSAVGFTVKHMMISKVKGQFATYDATIEFDEKKMAFTTLEGEVETGSIDTDNQKRDDHLRSPDFFDSAKFPAMTFKMTKYEGDGDEGKMYGDLTIKGTTKPVVFDVEIGGVANDPWGNTRLGFSMETKINRKDFGLNWNKVLEAGGFMVGEDVKITVDIEGIKM